MHRHLALNHSTLDLMLAAVFGIAGYLLKTRGFEPAPLLLAFVLTPIIRDTLNRALVFADGDLTTFVTHPLSAALLTIAGAALLMTALPGNQAPPSAARVAVTRASAISAARRSPFSKIGR